MSVKKIVIGAGILAIAGYFYLEQRVKKIIEQFEFVRIYPVAFKKLDAKWNDAKPFVTFNLDLKLVNPTAQNFSAQLTAVTLKRILFYDKKNMLLGTANVNVKAINIAANSSMIIPNVPVQLDLQTAITNVLGALNVSSFNSSDIRIEVIVSILGTEHKIS
ncbi:hypothetical protein [Flavobacterium hydatis]|jgi:hypothetical protein|uniref:Late embryogenesis abundant protein LEA-2 subgroup domain-containing protein n=1 Tax=Flavobacterium hydatis TaxID=991 RepID=A0A086AL09_FLAHY|nr:hypothetical protein [Flavobacterium hydatis]KFF17373.1 hypothetical protein IW20_08530 [Flavobacterium hydatis]OXA97328.1 hypothetical protein B0A62_03510 [Flavobacterium hydatis]